MVTLKYFCWELERKKKDSDVQLAQLTSAETALTCKQSSVSRSLADTPNMRVFLKSYTVS